MNVKYGTYTSDLGQLGLSRREETLRSQTQRKLSVRHTWDMTFFLVTQQRDTTQAQADIHAKYQAIRDAFSSDYKDISLVSGSTTLWSYSDSDTIGGIQVTVPPSHPQVRNANLTTTAEVQVTVSWEMPAAAAEVPAVVTFEETLEFVGGGKQRILLETLIGRPVAQIARRHSVYRVTQRGSAVGRHRRPAVPPALWPFALVDENPRVIKGQPRTQGNTHVDWPIAWTYDYQSAFELKGDPHVLGITYAEF